MAKITFSFTTDCEVTIEGDSYEDIYLKFKDFQHGDQQVLRRSTWLAHPPENSQVFFQIVGDDGLYEMNPIKGDYKKDIERQTGRLQS